MNKRVANRLKAFIQIQHGNGRYHMSQLSLHEQAIREHVQRGHEAGLTRQAGLLDQKNKI